MMLAAAILGGVGYACGGGGGWEGEQAASRAVNTTPNNRKARVSLLVTNRMLCLFMMRTPFEKISLFLDTFVTIYIESNK